MKMSFQVKYDLSVLYFYTFIFEHGNESNNTLFMQALNGGGPKSAPKVSLNILAPFSYM